MGVEANESPGLRLTYNPVTLSAIVTLIHRFSTDSADRCVSVLGSYLD